MQVRVDPAVLPKWTMTMLLLLWCGGDVDVDGDGDGGIVVSLSGLMLSG
jgi:hypothetical protein